MSQVSAPKRTTVDNYDIVTAIVQYCKRSVPRNLRSRTAERSPYNTCFLAPKTRPACHAIRKNVAARVSRGGN